MRVHSFAGLPLLQILPGRGDGSIGVVVVQMAGQRAGVGAAVVSDGRTIVLADDIAVKIHHPLARYVGRYGPHAVRGVADGATETELVRVQVVLREAGVREDLPEVVTLGAHGIRPGDARIRSREKIGDCASWRCSLAELVIALENMSVDRAVRAIRSRAAKFSIVIAVMAVGAILLCSHRNP